MVQGESQSQWSPGQFCFSAGPSSTEYMDLDFRTVADLPLRQSIEETSHPDQGFFGRLMDWHGSLQVRQSLFAFGCLDHYRTEYLNS
jgi:hypothetical protein